MLIAMQKMPPNVWHEIQFTINRRRAWWRCKNAKKHFRLSQYLSFIATASYSLTIWASIELYKTNNKRV